MVVDELEVMKWLVYWTGNKETQIQIYSQLWRLLGDVCKPIGSHKVVVES